MTFAIVAFPELRREDLGWIQKIREEYDDLFSMLGPHFTLVFPTDALGENQLVDHANMRRDRIDHCVVFKKRHEEIDTEHGVLRNTVTTHHFDELLRRRTNTTQGAEPAGIADGISQRR